MPFIVLHTDVFVLRSPLTLIKGTQSMTAMRFTSELHLREMYSLEEARETNSQGQVRIGSRV
jgi:hypothetical protein